MFNTKESMSIKDFMAGNYHMDALPTVIFGTIGISLPLIIGAGKASTGAAVAFKVLPLALLL